MIKKLSVFALLFVVCFAGRAQKVSIIPQPVSMQVANGNFILDQKTSFAVANAEDRKAADFFNDYLQGIYGFKLPVKKDRAGKYIQLSTPGGANPGATD